MFTKICNETETTYLTYQAVKQFGKDRYYLNFCIDSEKAFVTLSSGNKRKYKDIYEQKEYKSGGGLEALIWVRDTILEFPKFKRTKYILIGWADSRRKRIYKRGLCKFGFYEARVGGLPCLLKKNYD